MSIDIARAWKDAEYRKTLTREELASLPPNPAGSTEITNEQLEEVAAGGFTIFTFYGCDKPPK